MGDAGPYQTRGQGAFLADGNGTVLGFDRGMEDLTGFAALEVVGKRSPLGSLPLADGVDDESSAAPREIRLTGRDGTLLDVEAEITRAALGGDRFTVRILRVIARSAAPVSPADAGMRDALTGLATARAFGQRLEEALAAAGKHGRPLGLIVADVDRLRRTNDELGREAGDEVLRRLAGILRAVVGDDRNLARLGDDEFAIIVPGAGRGSARQIAARLRSTVERFRFFAGFEGPSLPVTLSLGAASFPADADGATALSDRAHEALDEARRLGRNRVWCYMRRPRVPVRTPVYLDGDEPLLVGYSQDLSPSGLFVATPAPVDIGMRCALSFPLPTAEGRVHVIGRVVRTVPLQDSGPADTRTPGMGVEFERFGPEDRRAIEAFLHAREGTTLRPETGLQSV